MRGAGVTHWRRARLNDFPQQVGASGVALEVRVTWIAVVEGVGSEKPGTLYQQLQLRSCAWSGL